MNLWIALLMLAMATVAMAGGSPPETEPPEDDAEANDPNTCSGDGKKVYQFNGRYEKTMMPCKYRALFRQKCGKYRVNLTPGNTYEDPKYRVETLWLSVMDAETDDVLWKGRTENVKIIKFLNDENDDGANTFAKKEGSLTTLGMFDITRGDDHAVVATTKNGDVKIMFRPYDLTDADFKRSVWSFTCLSSGSFEGAGYPKQVCGGSNATETSARRDDLGLDERSQVILFDTFSTSGIAQTGDCHDAEVAMTKTCANDQQRYRAIRRCSDILLDDQGPDCLRDNGHNPIKVFASCLKWICEGRLKKYCKGDFADAISDCEEDLEKLYNGMDKDKCFKKPPSINTR